MQRFNFLVRSKSRRDRSAAAHERLRECQRYGQRLGTVSRTDGVWTYYQLGDSQYRFAGSRCVGPITGDQMRQFGPELPERVRAIYMQCRNQRNDN